MSLPLAEILGDFDYLDGRLYLAHHSLHVYPKPSVSCSVGRGTAFAPVIFFGSFMRLHGTTAETSTIWTDVSTSLITPFTSIQSLPSVAAWVGAQPLPP